MAAFYLADGKAVWRVKRMDNTEKVEYFVTDCAKPPHVPKLFSTITSMGAGGGKVYCGLTGMLALCGVVLASGDIYYHKDKLPFYDVFTEKLTVKKGKEKAAEALRAGRVAIEDGVGVAYDLNGVKVCEAREAGEDALALAAACFVIEQEPTIMKPVVYSERYTASRAAAASGSSSASASSASPSASVSPGRRRGVSWSGVALKALRVLRALLKK